jgi:uncharacterized surface protein with fasciclin (FAS1) repeats
MQATSLSFRSSTLEEALRDADLGRFARGLVVAELHADIAAGPTTILAPIDSAFDALPWPFEEFVSSEELIEPCIDLFEYHVLRGPVVRDKMTQVTLHGELVRFGRDLVLGRYGAARVLSTFTVGSCTVHVLEQCVFPVPPEDYLSALGASS